MKGKKILIGLVMILLLVPTISAINVHQTNNIIDEEDIEYMEIRGGFFSISFSVQLAEGAEYAMANGELIFYWKIFPGFEKTLEISFPVAGDGYLHIEHISPAIGNIVSRVSAKLTLDGYETELTGDGFKIGPYSAIYAEYIPS